MAIADENVRGEFIGGVFAPLSSFRAQVKELCSALDRGHIHPERSNFFFARYCRELSRRMIDATNMFGARIGRRFDDRMVAELIATMIEAECGWFLSLSNTSRLEFRQEVLGFSVEEFIKSNGDPQIGLIEYVFTASKEASRNGGTANQGTQNTKTRIARSEYSARAEWLRVKLLERGWNKHDISRHCGPDHKTVQKILEGLRVREEVLSKLVIALNQKRGLPSVTILDIPPD